MAGDSLGMVNSTDAAGAVVHGRDGLPRRQSCQDAGACPRSLHVVQQAGVNHAQRAVQALSPGWKMIFNLPFFTRSRS